MINTKAEYYSKIKIISAIYLMLFAFSGCVEPYDFKVKNNTTGIVIESHISNKSFTDTKEYPSDGRFFTVRLAKTNDVNNIRDEYISSAKIEVRDDKGQTWPYAENTNKPGEYLLNNSSFKAEWGVAYQLAIELESGEQFESDWERLPAQETKAGAVSFTETTLQKSVSAEQNEQQIITMNGVTTNIEIPKNEAGETIYYRWDFDPLWVYTAALASIPSNIKTCWVTSPYYIRNFVIQKDNVGDYAQDLFFIETTSNRRIYEYFSVLVTQTIVSKEYYFFWQDLQAQKGKGGLYDQAPFNLPTNFKALNNNWTTNGYFGVITEDATRWVFNKADLSYYVYGNNIEACYPPPNTRLPPPAECSNCLEFIGGNATNIPPSWW